MKEKTRILAFELLGYFSNYVGGFNPSEDVIQRFPSSEPALLSSSSELAKKMLDSEGIENDISVDEYCTLHSQSICILLNELLADAISENGQIEWDLVTFTKVRRRFNTSEQGNLERKALLKGAHKRHFSEKRMFIFANDYTKAIFIHQLLMWFADEYDELTLTSTFLTPFMHRLTFKKGGELDSILS